MGKVCTWGVRAAAGGVGCVEAHRPASISSCTTARSSGVGCRRVHSWWAGGVVRGSARGICILQRGVRDNVAVRVYRPCSTTCS